MNKSVSGCTLISFLCRSLLCVSLILPTPLQAQTFAASPALIEESVPAKSSPQSIDTWTLLPQQLQAHTEASQMHLEDITLSIQPTYKETGERISQIELSYKGQRFWWLNKDVVTVVRYGHYVVFVTQDDLYDTHLRLSFIDLLYFRSALGKEDGYLAIFQMPIPLEAPLQSMIIENGFLKINDYEISRQMLDELGYLQSMIWNAQANLLQAQTFEETAPLIDGFLQSLENSQQTAIDNLARNTRGLTRHNNLQEMQIFYRQLTQSVITAQHAAAQTSDPHIRQNKAFHSAQRIGQEHLLEHQDISSRMEGALSLRFEVRRFFGRTALLFERLRSPQPNEGGRLRQALAIAMGGTFLLGIGATYPEEASVYAHQVMDISRIIVDFLYNNLMAFYEVVKASVNANAIFHPQQMWEAYLSEDSNSRKFIIANIVLVMGPLVFLAVSQLTVNAFYLLRDLKRMGFSNVTSAANIIALQNTQRQNYLINQATSLLGTNEREYSEEETLQVIEILNEHNKTDNPFKRFLERVTSPLSQISFLNRERMTDTRIRSLRQAMQNCFISLQSLEKTFVIFTYIWWKYGYFARTFIWKPSTLLGFLYYPNALQTISHLGPEMEFAHPLTNANGGLRPFWRQHPLSLQKLFGRGPYQAYQEWENLILPIEMEIMRQVRWRVLNASLQRIQSHPLEVTSSHVEETIKRLDRKQTQFYALAVDQMFKRVFARVMAPVFEGELCGLSVEACLADIDQHKASTLEALRNFHPSKEDIARAIEQVESGDEFYAEVEEKMQVSRQRSLWQSFMERVNRKLLKNIKNSAAVESWLMIENQMQDAGARARATRNALYHYFEKVPQLFITWAAVSGIMLSAMAGEIAETDIMVPLTDAFPYYSEYLFGAGFLVSTIFDMLAQFGRQLRFEYHLRRDGVFNHIPEGEDVHLSFMGWFWKQMQNKDNSYFKHIKTILRTTWANVPAYLTSFALIYALTLGRFPLDAYLIGYVMYLAFSPVEGFHVRINQVMEATMAGYWMRYIPEHLRGHSLAQSDAIKHRNKYSGIFRVFYIFFYSNIIDATIQNIQMISINTSREFVRIVFGGHPPTVWGIKALEAANEYMGKVPVMGNMINTCQNFLAHNYDGWDPLRDGPPPEGVIPWKANK